MTYFLWNKISHQPVTSAFTDQIAVFASEQDAINYLKKEDLSFYINEYAIRPFVNDAWAWRERNRINEGEYDKLIWSGLPWFDERVEELCVFGHVDGKDPSKVRYTEDAKKGAVDRHTSTTPGRFLKKFYGDILTQDQIKFYAEQHREAFVDGEISLNWARTPEEIADVYEMPASFGSCMQHLKKQEWPELPCHPTSVYGAGDLALAYITKGTRLISRALVWREKQLVGRVYGDAIRLRSALRKEGIITKSNGSEFDSLEGAKLIKKVYVDPLDDREPKKECVILPYIDGVANNVMDVGDHLVIHKPKIVIEDGMEVVKDDGKYLAWTTEGYCIARPACPLCSRYGNIFSVVTNLRPSEQLDICEKCTSEVAFLCHDSGRYYHSEHFTGIVCNYYDNEAITIRTLSKLVCLEQHATRYHKSIFSGSYWDIDSMTELADGSRCSITEALLYCTERGGKLYPKEEYLPAPIVDDNLFSAERMVA